MRNTLKQYTIAILIPLFCLFGFWFVYLSGPDGDYPTNWYDVSLHPNAVNEQWTGWTQPDYWLP